MEKASSLKYWLHWPSLVCEFIIFLCIVAAFAVLFKWERLWSSVEEEQRKRGGRVYDDELWRSCWKKISPLRLLVCRGILFLLMVGLLASDLKVNGLGVLYLYSEWTFTLLTIYFGLATFISIKARSQWSKQGSDRELHERTDSLTMDREQRATETSGENLNNNSVTLQSYDEWQENKKKAGFWGFTMQIVFQTSAGAVMLTDIVFWFGIVPFMLNQHISLHLLRGWQLTGCMHLVNALSLLIESAFNSMKQYLLEILGGGVGSDDSASLGSEVLILCCGLQCMSFSNGFSMHVVSLGGHIHFLISQRHWLHYGIVA